MTLSPRISALALALLAGLACALAAVSWPGGAARAAGCGPRGYAYAGLELPVARHGIGAGLASVAPAVVERGHVAGWVGVGGPGQGPGGTDEWLQVGLNTQSDGGRNRLYYEIARPSGSIRYVEVDADVPAGRPLRVAVLEMFSRPGTWRVWVGGRPVSPPIFLPGSHLALTPMAMTENWDAGAAVCNRFAYRFRHVVTAGAAGGAWRALERADVLQDRGYQVVRDRSADFVATTDPPPSSAS
jgi:hypothetical protein